MEWHARRVRELALPALLSLGTACADRSATEPADPASARAAAAPAGVLASTMGFRRAVTVDAIRVHQAALQAIADANGDRSVPGAGHAASIEYVRQQMVAAGYTVSVQSFPVTFSGDASAPVLEQVSPAPRTFATVTFTNSGSGDVTAPLVAVDLGPLPPSIPSTSGCEAADFAGFPAGAIALMRRGTCLFAIKVQNAMAAGAVAAVIFNSGLPDDLGLERGTLGLVQIPFPAVATDFATGIELANGVLNGPTGATVRVRTDYVVVSTTAENVIAELPVGNPADVIVVGAPIDSRPGDPGINASSGATSMLEIARVFASQERDARNRLRFVWFGASQIGNYGAEAYVAGLSAAEVAGVRAMVHLDRIGSPNFVRFVESGAAPGSAGVAAVFGNYFNGVALASLTEPLQAASPGDPFSDLDIPTAGLFTGSSVLKTSAQAAVFGGTAGAAYDPCAIGTCDGFNNVSLQALEQMSDAAAHGVLLLSKRNFAKNPLTPN